MVGEIRTFFLREFAKDLIINSKPKKEIFPYHPVKPSLIPEDISQESHFALSQSMSPSIKLNTSETSGMIPFQPGKIQFRPIVYPVQKTNSPPRYQSHVQEIQQPGINIQIKPRVIPQINPAIAEISPVPQPIPAGFSLGRLNPIISDNTITTIECSGPGKLVMVRGMGKVSSTRITLSEQEIKTIIETFSRTARIPILGGMFKAAIGNLVITAVISEFVGSRFIINKYTPYSILENRM